MRQLARLSIAAWQQDDELVAGVRRDFDDAASCAAWPAMHGTRRPASVHAVVDLLELVDVDDDERYRANGPSPRIVFAISTNGRRV
jgi:hypothetical protein